MFVASPVNHKNWLEWAEIVEFWQPLATVIPARITLHLALKRFISALCPVFSPPKGHGNLGWRRSVPSHY